MPSFKNQIGLAPVIIIVSLLSLGAVLAGGYYALTQKKIVPIVNPAPAQIPTLPIEKVKETNESQLLKMDGVKSVEVGKQDDKPCIVVFTFKETDELNNLENNGLDGYRVQVENTSQSQ